MKEPDTEDRRDSKLKWLILLLCCCSTVIN